MEFKFENGDENVIATLAFALYDDNAISTAYAGKPLSIYQMTQVLGQVINASVVKSDNFKNWIDRRDEIHRIARCFCESMQAAPSAAIWEKADKANPNAQKVLFTLKGDKTILKGDFKKESLAYVTDDQKVYPVEKVAYWCYCPSAPIENDEELDTLAPETLVSKDVL